MLHWIIFPPPDWTGNLSFRNRVSCLHLQSCTGIKDRAAFVRQIWRGGPTAKMERKREWNLWNRKPPRVCVGLLSSWGYCRWWGSDGVPGQPSTSTGPRRSWLWTLTLVSQVFKSCFCFCFFFPNHYLVVTNPSLGEGQGFKTEENNFHKNIKNGKTLLCKNFAIQTKWQLLRISIKC